MAITITRQPVSIVAAVGDTITFRVEATGVYQYRWQNRLYTDSTWNNSGLSGYSTSTLTIPVIEARYSYLWRCELTDYSGNVVYTDAVTIRDPAKSVGFVEYSTLAAIADAIRAKTETTDTMLPSEMPGYIDTITRGGVIRTGTIQASGNSFTLGVDLPERENYVFMMLLSNLSSAYKDRTHIVDASICHSGGETESSVNEFTVNTSGNYVSHYDSSDYANAPSIDHAAGTITLGIDTALAININNEYEWLYAAWEGDE